MDKKNSVIAILLILTIGFCATTGYFYMMNIESQDEYQILSDRYDILNEWLNGNKTLLQETIVEKNQLESWLEDNTTGYEFQIQILNTQIEYLTAQIVSLNAVIISLQNETRSTLVINDKMYTLKGVGITIIDVNGTGELVYFTYSTDNPLVTLCFYIDGKYGFNFQIQWEYEVAERRNNTPMAQILRYDSVNSVYVAQILIPLEFEENFTVRAYVSDMSEGEIHIWELILVGDFN